ncbi:DUF2147 domain-containing protein [Tenacibaculum ovolyticum]|uniref:DUF2147 domain-containing protein n=1 Tax=Tenacibaculum ovolyticum TaxID=104270 RepID=UPI0007EC4039|nr:DUF2147 domain-containing protein [Tenacibaculum ovolyticum]
MKYLFLLAILALSTTAKGQNIVGQWETYDDKTNEKKGVVKIYKTNNLYFAKIVKKYGGEKNTICKECKGDKKDKPILGLIIIENLNNTGTRYEGGTILDPQTGKIYSCYLELIKDNKLKVRGFIGMSILGRTQYWNRK